MGYNLVKLALLHSWSF